ncbi:tetratricopeptide repeat protein [Aspergillus clavatus NRRL 1]|uniref:HCP-like protein n=1 Tax=Aspergillus clavatus (strain ATCC 1007 / CBS 513.65 / DSM 816 / NCTC 3887 / NRRL 1 / QM 1276 / 107) TaxID=344612 RepID=A1C485_ASPCL|nr:uncharacterized protein ACLA_058870 [Aspergillus clavatus NRRL 1]EAW15225.1 conserved hypothetical protein [Aspergillus clavatus NRRL 1]
MPLRDILHKKDRINEAESQYAPNASSSPVPEIKFIRSDTLSHQLITPPSYEGDENIAHRAQNQAEFLDPARPSSSTHRRSLNIFSRSWSPSDASEPASPTRPHGERRLSHLLGRDRGSRSTSANSTIIPADLPQISDDKGDEQEREAQWEKRATILAQQSPLSGSSAHSAHASPGALGTRSVEEGRSRSSSHSRINDPQGDVNIQEAIRLHEAGELEKSTDMFRQLADPNGANNALSQVLYGLALRHGWGCPPNPNQAVTYLSAAAANSASIESEALQAGMKKGGAAKGELVLAIFELGNCYRNGWGVKKDPVAARQYFETAANLGDTDAMNEAAWCYLEGFGGKKDKFKAAKYYRLAEDKGNKLVGNSWIWKEKYNSK